MSKLRISSYLNHIDIGDGTSLLYNGATLSIDVVPTEYITLLYRGGDDLSPLTPQNKEHLLKRGHLTDLTPKRELEEFGKRVSDYLEQRTRLDREKKAGTLYFVTQLTIAIFRAVIVSRNPWLIR